MLAESQVWSRLSPKKGKKNSRHNEFCTISRDHKKKYIIKFNSVLNRLFVHTYGGFISRFIPTFPILHRKWQVDLSLTVWEEGHKQQSNRHNIFE